MTTTNRTIRARIRRLLSKVNQLLLWTIAFAAYAATFHFLWEYSRSSEEALQYAIDTILKIIGGTGAVLALYVGWKRVTVMEDGQITERFTRAIDHLGHAELNIRLGGIYALERISKDSKGDHRDYHTVIEILAAFIRNQSAKVENKENKKVNEDVQAAITVIGRRKVVKRAPRVNLNNANLKGANLAGVDLAGVNLAEANLNHADLAEANLAGVFLAEANLTGAFLTEVNLTGAFLAEANLTGAFLAEANLIGAFLTEANLYYAKSLTVSQILSAATLYRAKNISGSLKTRAKEIDSVLWNLLRVEPTEENQEQIKAYRAKKKIRASRM